MEQVPSSSSTEDLLERQARRMRNDQRIIEWCDRELTSRRIAQTRNGWITRRASSASFNVNLFDFLMAQEQLQPQPLSIEEMITTVQRLTQRASPPHKPKRKHIFTQAANTPTGWECVICLCDEQNDIVESPCKPHHTFHKECLTKWFDNNETCPVCRQDS